MKAVAVACLCAVLLVIGCADDDRDDGADESDDVTTGDLTRDQVAEIRHAISDSELVTDTWPTLPGYLPPGLSTSFVESGGTETGWSMIFYPGVPGGVQRTLIVDDASLHTTEFDDCNASLPDGTPVSEQALDQGDEVQYSVQFVAKGHDFFIDAAWTSPESGPTHEMKRHVIRTAESLVANVQVEGMASAQCSRDLR